MPADHRSRLAALLRTWRERALLTQQELANRTGLGVRTIRRLEADGVRRPRGGSVRLLADALDLGEDERTQLAAAARGNPAAPPPNAAPVPRQLPADIAGFTGRTRHLKELDELLTGDSAAVVSAISGTAGVGKTALAVRWAHRIARHFPDGQLYVNLHGFHPDGPAMSPTEALRGFLDGLGVPPPRVPTDLAARAALFRTLLADRRVLVVLDNARDAEQIRPLLPGTPGCVTLITSRHRLTGLIASENAHPVTLTTMSTVEAHELVARRLGVDRVAAEPDAVDGVIARCARLPLALAIWAARAASRPDLSLTELAAELGPPADLVHPLAGPAASHGRLDAFATGDPATDLRAVFSWSYRYLDGDAARLFRLLGLHPGPDCGARAAASLAGTPLRRARPLLAELADANLIAEPNPGRYALHDLLRSYAIELAHDRDDDHERGAALHRVLDHYLHTADTADRLIEPNRGRIPMARPRPGVTPESPADRDGAMAWLTTEHRVLLAAVERAGEAGFDSHAWQLAWTLTTFLHRQGHLHDLVETQRTGLAAVRRLDDRAGAARAHRSLGMAYTLLGRPDEAHDHYRYALDLFDELGDRNGQAYTQLSLTQSADDAGDHEGALRHARQALALFRATHHRPGQASALSAIGWCHARLGDHRQALASCRQAMAAHQQLGARSDEAYTWDSLGFTHRQLGQYPEAVRCYRRAIALWRDIADRTNEADATTRLGDTHAAAGDLDAARAAWQRALTILDALDHPHAEQVRARLVTDGSA